jgi:hypothetical protein
MGLATALKGAVADACGLVHTNRGQPRDLTINPVNSREFAKDVGSDLQGLIANVRISAI